MQISLNPPQLEGTSYLNWESKYYWQQWGHKWGGDPPHRLGGSENTKIKMINPLQMRWQPHLIVSVGVKIAITKMINPLQMRWQPHLMASVGGNMPARFAWADIRVRSTSVLLTRTCNWPALTVTCHYHSKLFLAPFPVETPTMIIWILYLFQEHATSVSE